MQFHTLIVKGMRSTMHRHSLRQQRLDEHFHATMKLEENLCIQFVSPTVQYTQRFQICQQRQKILLQSKISLKFCIEKFLQKKNIFFSIALMDQLQRKVFISQKNNITVSPVPYPDLIFFSHFKIIGV